MALVHYEHFDLYNNSVTNLALRPGHVVVGSQLSISGTGARTGSSCASWNNVNASGGMQVALPSRAVIGVGGAFRVAGNNFDNNADQSGFHLRSGATTVRAVMTTDLRIALYVGSTLVGQSAPGVFVNNSYFWLEFKAVTGASGSASLEARINGTTVVLVTGLTFATAIDQLIYGRTGPGTHNYTMDDLVVWDNTGTENNDWMGDSFVIAAAPNSDAAANDWTASTGTARWDMIDEAAPNDTDFITGPTAGAIQECGTTTPTLPATGGVAAVAVQARALKTDTGVSAIALGIASGLSSHNSAPAVNLGTGAQVFSHIVERNPDGDIPWTQSTAQAARFRVQRTA